MKLFVICMVVVRIVSIIRVTALNMTVGIMFIIIVNKRGVMDTRTYLAAIIVMFFVRNVAPGKKMKNEGLLVPKFDRVEGYLKSGNIRGVFAKILKDINVLLYQFYSIKKTVDTGITPDIKSTWKLNQTFSETILFGQYFSRVLYEVK